MYVYMGEVLHMHIMCVSVCVCVSTLRGQIPDSIDHRIELIIIKQLIIDLPQITE